jgi:hypothetical protein
MHCAAAQVPVKSTSLLGGCLQVDAQETVFGLVNLVLHCVSSRLIDCSKSILAV